MKRGFTMVEMIIVITLLLILSTIFVQYNLFKIHRTISYTIANEMQKLSAASQSFYNEFQKWPSSTNELVKANYLPNNILNFWKHPYLFEQKTVTAGPHNISVDRLTISTLCPKYISKYLPTIMPDINIETYDTKTDKISLTILPIDHILALKNKISHNPTSNPEKRTLRGDVYLVKGGKISSLNSKYNLIPDKLSKLKNLECKTLIIEVLTIPKDFNLKAKTLVVKRSLSVPWINGDITFTPEVIMMGVKTLEDLQRYNNTSLSARNIYGFGDDSAVMANKIHPDSFYTKNLTQSTIRAGTFIWKNGYPPITKEEIDAIMNWTPSTPPSPTPPSPPSGEEHVYINVDGIKVCKFCKYSGTYLTRGGPVKYSYKSGDELARICRSGYVTLQSARRVAGH